MEHRRSEVLIALQHELRHTRAACNQPEPVMAVAQQKRPSAAPLKDLYDIGEIPPLGHVPPQMHAWAIRKERHGPPEKSMQQEVLPTWPIGED
jgi:hypothetical protein